MWVCKWECLSTWVSVCVCLSEWVCLWWWAMLIKREYVPLKNECLCVCVCVCAHVFVYENECVSLSMWLSVFLRMRHVDTSWICSAEEFLELYGKVDAVVRNCLLRWSGHLFEVPSTHLFDQCFCFKHISIFYAPTGAFFRLYPPFLCYTKDFTCRSWVALNPCVSTMNQDLEK